MIKAGFSQCEITPDIPLKMGGYRLRQQESKGIHDKLMASCAVIADDQNIITLISLDLIGLDEPALLNIHKKIHEQTEISPENILICCTHTHSGPDTFFLLGEDKKIRLYCNELANKIAQTVKAAKSKIEKVNISIKVSDVYGVSFNRRLVLEDGTVCLNLKLVPDTKIKRRGPIDSNLYSVYFENNSAIKGVIANFTLHPTVLGEKNFLYSRDYPGYFTDAVRDKIHVSPVVIFCNGAFGNINQIKTPGQWISSFSEAERIGKILANQLVGEPTQKNFVNSSFISTAYEVIKIPHRNSGYDNIEQINEKIHQLEEKINRSQNHNNDTDALEICYLNEAKSLLQQKFSNARIHVFKIGNIEIVALPGEVFVEYALEIKKSSDCSYCLVLGNCSNYIGYVPLKKSFEEGSYETRFGWTSRLIPEAGDMILKTVQKLRFQLPEKTKHKKPTI